MRVFSVVSGKGGAGKTLFSIAMAHVLSNKIIFSDLDRLLDKAMNESVSEEKRLELNKGEFSKLKQRKRMDLIRKYRNKILVVDMDLHVKGLTFLMYPDLRVVEKYHISSYQIVNDEISVQNLKIRLEDLKSVVGESIFVIPSTDLSLSVDWVTVHEYKVVDLIKKLGILKKAASLAGFDFLILDTRAGPDYLSIAAALISEFAFLLIEQDNVSKRAAIQFSGDVEHERREVSREQMVPDLAVSRLAFVRNKLIRPETREERLVLEKQLYLHGIPFDKSLLREYSKGTFDFREENLLNTRFGWHAERTVRGALNTIRVPFEHKPSTYFSFRFITERVMLDALIMNFGILLLILSVVNEYMFALTTNSLTSRLIALWGVLLTILGWLMRSRRG
jgi:cellulose biosynthesis protein BcsQ